MARTTQHAVVQYLTVEHAAPSRFGGYIILDQLNYSPIAQLSVDLHLSIPGSAEAGCVRAGAEVGGGGGASWISLVRGAIETTSCESIEPTSMKQQHKLTIFRTFTFPFGFGVTREKCTQCQRFFVGDTSFAATPTHQTPPLYSLAQLTATTAAVPLEKMDC